MSKFGLRPGRLLPLVVLAGAMASATAAPATTSAEDAGITQDLAGELARFFTLSKELPIDPALRVAADNIRAAHLARIKQLLPTWLQEERRLQASGTEKANSNSVFFAVSARLLNELALWHIEPGDAAYENATLEVLKTSPLVCRTASDSRFHDFSSRMLRVQAMPAAQQQAALATERQLLERWGKPRPALQPWPNPLPEDAAMQVVAQMQAGAQRPPLALTPHLASSLLAKREPYKDQAWEARCGLQRWWLRVSIAQGSTPAAALNAFRYGTLLTATEYYGENFEPAVEEGAKPETPAKPKYPRLAQNFGVTGETIVTRARQASGQLGHASVTGRKIDVIGIRGTRPVAFENVFDALALQYALKQGDSEKPGSAKPAAFKMVWNLHGETP